MSTKAIIMQLRPRWQQIRKQNYIKGQNEE